MISRVAYLPCSLLNQPLTDVYLITSYHNQIAPFVYTALK